MTKIYGLKSIDYRTAQLETDKNNGRRYMVCQSKRGTVLYSVSEYGRDYREIALPHKQYALSTNTPASGARGLSDFFKDAEAAI